MLQGLQIGERRVQRQRLPNPGLLRVLQPGKPERLLPEPPQSEGELAHGPGGRHPASNRCGTVGHR